MPKESYQTKLLERIAYQTSGSMLEFDKYLEMVVKKPKYERKRRRKVEPLEVKDESYKGDGL